MSIFKDRFSPEDFRTDTHYWSTFDNCETEVSARWVIMFLQDRGEGWAPFTVGEINEFYHRRRLASLEEAVAEAEAAKDDEATEDPREIRRMKVEIGALRDGEARDFSFNRLLKGDHFHCTGPGTGVWLENPGGIDVKPSGEHGRLAAEDECRISDGFIRCIAKEGILKEA